MSKRKNHKVKRKPDRKLKDYEIDVDVIDLDSYVAFYTQDYSPLTIEDEDGFEQLLTFKPENDEDNSIDVEELYFDFMPSSDWTDDDDGGVHD